MKIRPCVGLEPQSCRAALVVVEKSIHWNKFVSLNMNRHGTVIRKRKFNRKAESIGCKLERRPGMG